jgi:dethiobiotin synthetase
MTRPTSVVFVTGTGTEVGKTWWTAHVAAELRAAGVAVAARKPVQSGDGSAPDDSAVLAAATGEEASVVTPPHRTYELAWAPPMAATELGLPPYTVADLVRETAWPDATRVGLVEGVGGPHSPIAFDGDNVDLARALGPDVVVLVADAGLGAINAVRLSVTALAGFPVVVACNRYEPEGLPRRNHDFLMDAGYDLVTSPTELARRLA